jgi:hypothetical protein
MIRQPMLNTKPLGPNPNPSGPNPNPFGLSLSKPVRRRTPALRHGAFLRQAQDDREYKLRLLLRVNGNTRGGN